MSLNADLIYNDIRDDISNRVVFNYFSDLHKMLCDILYKEQMDLDLENPTVYEEAIGPVRKAIKAMQNDPNLEVWYNGGY